MKCPFCLKESTKVLDSRESENSIRRRRECDNASCQKRFTTYERVEMTDVSIIKKDGGRELFSRDKLARGIQKACEKRPVTQEEINDVVSRVESALRNLDKEEVKSKVVGELVMDELRQLDEVAYVRYASVYRRFRDVSQFMIEVQRLQEPIVVEQK